jgi:hypothetical protein
MPTIHAKLPDALENHDIRRACCAVEAIFRAGTILDELPPASLEEIRDYCTAWNEGRKGSFSRFKHAWIDMVVEHLNDQRLERTGCTRPLPAGCAGAQRHELPARTSTTGSGDYEEHDKW